MLKTQYKEFPYALHPILTPHVVMVHLSKLQNSVGGLLVTKLQALLGSLQVLYQCSFPV